MLLYLLLRRSCSTGSFSYRVRSPNCARSYDEARLSSTALAFLFGPPYEDAGLEVEDGRPSRRDSRGGRSKCHEAIGSWTRQSPTCGRRKNNPLQATTTTRIDRTTAAGVESTHFDLHVDPIYRTLGSSGIGRFCYLRRDRYGRLLGGSNLGDVG